MKLGESGLAKKKVTSRKEKTNAKMMADIEKSTTKTSFIELWMDHIP